MKKLGNYFFIKRHSCLFFFSFFVFWRLKRIAKHNSEVMKMFFLHLQSFRDSAASFLNPLAYETCWIAQSEMEQLFIFFLFFSFCFFFCEFFAVSNFSLLSLTISSTWNFMINAFNWFSVETKLMLALKMIEIIKIWTILFITYMNSFFHFFNKFMMFWYHVVFFFQISTLCSIKKNPWKSCNLKNGFSELMSWTKWQTNTDSVELW